MNPVNYESRTLPLAELRLLLAKCRAPAQGKDAAGRFTAADGMTMADVSREAGIPCRSRLYRILRGDVKHGLGPAPLSRLSRFLLKVEHGLAVKNSGQVVYLEQPTRKPDHVVRIAFGPSGRPRLVLERPSAAPDQLPQFPKSFTFPRGPDGI